jgi:hypothetical protein
MSRQVVQQQQRLKEVSGLVGVLTERMMTAYVVGSRPSEAEVMAFCRGVLLLEEHEVSLPHFAEDVIARLQAQEAADRAKSVLPSVYTPVPQSRGAAVLDWLLRPFRAFRLA